MKFRLFEHSAGLTRRTVLLYAAGIFLVSQAVFLCGIDQPHHLYFDEGPYVRAALAYLRHEPPLNREHPPLAKWFMAQSIAVFGDTPLGWRYASAFFGSFSLVGLYLWGLALFGDHRPARWATVAAHSGHEPPPKDPRRSRLQRHRHRRQGIPQERKGENRAAPKAVRDRAEGNGADKEPGEGRRREGGLGRESPEDGAFRAENARPDQAGRKIGREKQVVDFEKRPRGEEEHQPPNGPRHRQAIKPGAAHS